MHVSDRDRPSGRHPPSARADDTGGRARASTRDPGGPANLPGRRRPRRGPDPPFGGDDARSGRIPASSPDPSPLPLARRRGAGRRRTAEGPRGEARRTWSSSWTRFGSPATTPSSGFGSRTWPRSTRSRSPARRTRAGRRATASRTNATRCASPSTSSRRRSARPGGNTPSSSCPTGGPRRLRDLPRPHREGDARERVGRARPRVPRLDRLREGLLRRDRLRRPRGRRRRGGPRLGRRRPALRRREPRGDRRLEPRRADRPPRRDAPPGEVPGGLRRRPGDRPRDAPRLPRAVVRGPLRREEPRREEGRRGRRRVPAGEARSSGPPS